MYKNVLVPVVFDDDHDTALSIKTAQTLADPDAKFWLMHVLDSIPVYAMHQIPDELLVQARISSEDDLNKLAEALPDSETVLKTGHAGRQIVNHASSSGCDCIVVASHIPKFEDFFLGSTADWVVRHAKCAVHVIR